MQEDDQTQKVESGQKNHLDGSRVVYGLSSEDTGGFASRSFLNKTFLKQEISHILGYRDANEIGCQSSLRENIGDDLEELDLSKSQLDPQKIMQLVSKSDFSKNLRALNLSQNNLQDKGIQIFIENKTSWTNLENLNLADNHLGTIGAKSLSCKSTMNGLKQLDISRNCIENEGVKFIAEGSYLNKLKVLILSNVSIDYHGIRSLVTNNSWIKLEELYLQDNPLICDLGAIELSLAKQWKNLKKLILNGSNVGAPGIELLRRNKIFKRLFSDQCIQKGKLVDRFCCEEKKQKSTLFSRQLKSLLRTQSRGGGRKDFGNSTEEIEDQNLLETLYKIDQYRRRIIQDDKDLESEFSLYVESLGRLSSTHRDPASESFVLAFEIKKRLLSPDSKLKVLLLTGETGTGKTMFCRYLQKAMLTEWDDSSQHESNERAWIPVFIDLSRYTRAEQLTPFTLTDVLKKQLSLTDSEIKSLQENHSNQLLPHLLFIFDEYDQVLQSQNKSLVNYTINDCIQNNFCRFSGFEAHLKNAKIMITCRTEALSHFQRKDVLFGHLDKSTRNLIPESYSEFVLQPFGDAQITSYLRKHSYFNLLRRLDNEDKEVSSDSVSESWGSVKKYEKMIDAYGLRELVRSPLILFLVTNILPDLIRQEKELSKRDEMII